MAKNVVKTNLQILYPSVDENIIDLAIEIVEDYIKDYCNLSEIPTELKGTELSMAQEDINKLQSEGFQSETAGGASISYLTDYSDKIYKSLNRHKKPRLVGA